MAYLALGKRLDGECGVPELTAVCPVHLHSIAAEPQIVLNARHVQTKALCEAWCVYMINHLLSKPTRLGEYIIQIYRVNHY